MTRVYSTKPQAIKRRLRKRMKDQTKDIELYYRKPVKDWDFEELQRGRPKNEHGRFPNGMRPRWITDAVLAEAQQRLVSVSREQLSEHVGAAISVLHDMMKDFSLDDMGKPMVPAGVRLDAAKYIIDQVIGKSKSHVRVEGQVELTNMLADVVVNPDGEDAHPVLDVEWEEVDDE